MEYLLILLSLLAIALFLKWRFSILLFPTLQSAFLCLFFLFVTGILWDYLGVSRGHWAYPGPGLAGFFIGPLPIEDFFFMVVVPFWIIVIYRLFSQCGKNTKRQN